MCGTLLIRKGFILLRKADKKNITNLQKRGEITVKGKGIMTTYWVLGKGISAGQIVSPGPMQAGIPNSQVPSLQRQTSHHSSLAAVVFGMMQASKRTNKNATRKYPFFIYINLPRSPDHIVIIIIITIITHMAIIIHYICLYG